MINGEKSVGGVRTLRINVSVGLKEWGRSILSRPMILVFDAYIKVLLTNRAIFLEQ